MKVLVALLFMALVVLHQDVWWWGDRTVVLGFVPIGLAYHALLSLAAAALWWLAVATCWPRDLEDDERVTAAPPPPPEASEESGGDP
jgi:hypothetical protein